MRHTTKLKDTNHNEEKSQSTESDREMPPRIELGDKHSNMMATAFCILQGQRGRQAAHIEQKHRRRKKGQKSHF